MNRQCSQHGLPLEKGLRCDKGYIQVLIRCNNTTICKNFGPHTKDSQEVACIFLAEKRRENLKGRIGILPELPSKTFKEVSEIWYSLWTKEVHPDGTISHNKESCYKVRWTLKKVLHPIFGHKKFEEIRAVDIEVWRHTYTKKGLSGTTANRYQAILSSIFSHVDKWIKTERIKPAFKVPCEDLGKGTYSCNPCDAVEMAPSKKRKRILSKYEGSKLKLACIQLNDLDGWEICKMALKSVLSLKDLKALEIGAEIDTLRSKTQVPINIPLPVLTKLNFFGWRTRWEKIREKAGFLTYKTVLNKKGQSVQIMDDSHPSHVVMPDLRKTGINWLKGRHDLKLISEYAGHADIKTTEASYTIKQSEYLEPLARDLEGQVEEL